jgi:putative hydrolase of the HAD superfamily
VPDPRILGVIFDLGGTLIAPGSWEEANARALLTHLRRRGHRLPDEFVDALLAERQARWAARTGFQEATADGALRAVLERYHLPAAPADVDGAERAFFTPELDGVRPLPDAVGVLARLNRQGLRTALVSNASSHYFVVECCRRLLFAEFLDPIVSSAAVGWAKPDPRPFHAVLRAWRLPPEALVMVGDSPAADVAGAAALGMRSILLTAAPEPGPGPAAALDSVRPDAIAATLLDAAGIIEDWKASL